MTKISVIIPAFNEEATIIEILQAVAAQNIDGFDFEVIVIDDASSDSTPKLLAGNVITSHTDKHPSFHCGHRIHVPITTNPHVRFMINGQPYQLKVGEAYEINNQKTHSVMNKGAEDRITFIFDYVPPGQIDAAQSM